MSEQQVIVESPEEMADYLDTNPDLKFVTIDSNFVTLLDSERPA
ncbi:MAG: hypothetical protein Q9M91_03325 [Candidatus Dojkabacteria bacterium]|nr:hypothetical protein [Candidatus Dojkabacteria bacterium]MDQ7020855.1 hypothetical protein [Candidatus Dojkabacteria bacterium]